MAQIITVEEFAKREEIKTVAAAMRLLNKNKFAKVKVNGKRRPNVNWDLWNKKLSA